VRSERWPKRSRLSFSIWSFRCAISAWSADSCARAAAASACATISAALSASISSGRAFGGSMATPIES
jgi:hypothetical protein